MRKVALATVLAVLSISLLVTHLSRVEGYVLQGKRWLAPTAIFYVNMSGADGLWNTGFENAMARWNAATGFTFSVVRTFEDPCDGGDRRSGVGFSDMACDDAFGDNTLAVEITWTTLGTVITESNIVFNRNKTWNVYDGAYKTGQWSGISDFRRVAVHELGHSLGLDHEDDVPAIMKSVQTFGNTLIRPTSDDIAGVAAIYAAGNPPSAPTLSGPSNGLTNVSLSPTLSWISVAGATSYSLYFGTSSNPPLVQNANTLITSYNTGTLSPNTTYYWRVVARNSVGSNSSSTYRFTTMAVPPARPTLLSPSHRATDVSVTPTLQWSSAASATSYDVFFGTEVSPPLVGNTTGTSWSPGTLSGNQVYWWWVRAKNSLGETASEFQRSFRTRQTTPILGTVAPQVGIPGTTFQVTITGANLGDANSVEFSGNGIQATVVPIGQTETSLHVAITVDSNAQAGWRTLTVTNADGNSEPFDGFMVRNDGNDQEFTVDLAAGYYTAEVTLLTTTTPITLPGASAIQAEIALTPEQQAVGLVGRPSLDALAGMLYVHANDDIFVHSTMGMSFPIDIVWIDNSGKVTSVSRDAPPCPVTETECPLYEGSVQARYVLEINAGHASALGIEEGVQLSFDLPAQLIGKKAGYWGMEVLSSGRVLSGGFNLGGGYSSTSAPAFGGFLLEEVQTVEMAVNAQPLPGQEAPSLQMGVLNSLGTQIIGPIHGTTSAGLNASLLSGYYTATLSSGLGRGTFQLALAAPRFVGGVVVGGYLEDNIVGFGGFNLGTPAQVTIRLFNSTYGTAASGRVQLRLVDSAGQPVIVTQVQ